MAVEIRPSVLREQIENGMKKKELAEHYGLPMMQMTKILQQLGLRIKQNHMPKFVIVDETEEVNHTVTQEDIKNNPELVEQDVQVGDTITLRDRVEVMPQDEW